MIIKHRTHVSTKVAAFKVPQSPVSRWLSQIPM